MSQSGTRKLIFIIGPPAVGKMTVGRELSELSGIPLFHNHLSIEAVLPVFDFGTPQFNRLVGDFRLAMFNQVAESDLPGLIFTFVWAFGRPNNLSEIERFKDIFEKRGAETCYVELEADLEVRLERNEQPDRLAAKPSKRDVKASRSRLLDNEQRFQLNSNGNFPFENHLIIDNTNLSPKAAAEMIMHHFDITYLGKDESR